MANLPVDRPRLLMAESISVCSGGQRQLSVDGLDVDDSQSGGYALQLQNLRDGKAMCTAATENRLAVSIEVDQYTCACTEPGAKLPRTLQPTVVENLIKYTVESLIPVDDVLKCFAAIVSTAAIRYLLHHEVVDPCIRPRHAIFEMQSANADLDKLLNGSYVKIPVAPPDLAGVSTTPIRMHDFAVRGVDFDELGVPRGHLAPPSAPYHIPKQMPSNVPKLDSSFVPSCVVHPTPNFELSQDRRPRDRDIKSAYTLAKAKQ